MDRLAGKVAFITGGASGIGYGMAQAFLSEGMNVVIADIEQTALDVAVAKLARSGGNMAGIACDVSNAESVDAAAAFALKKFRKVHVVCNNAGVNPLGRLDDIRPTDWRWVFDVNLMGMLHGVKTFLPILKAQDEGGHFVHTCSAVGLALPETANGGFSAYSASKYAAVGLSEKLAIELAPLGLGVSMLCPSFVRTNLTASERNRGARYAGPSASEEARKAHAALLDSGLEPLDVGQRVIRAIKRNELYILPHQSIRKDVERRFRAMLAAFDRQA